MSTQELTQSKMMQLLDWSYEKALNGLPGTPDAFELADNYLRKHTTVEKSVNSLIRMQNTKAGTSGFLTGLGGIITLPVAIPANIASVVYVQMRMVAAIAVMGGYDLKDDQVKTLVFVSLAGNGAVDILKQTGIEIGKKFAISAIKKIPGTVITKINQKVGFKLLTKFGEKGTVNLVKVVPVIGGVVGATVDVTSTMAVGKTAKKIFITG
ncbi:EcsC family protein [Cytobacillus oceanisediminis]|uniref:EcsC family protein n=1 Tax=Cytobacillus TaxID=2675230 RepID=UPI00203B7498|nr:EcsC family protein [Cytobacillus oceanisediminis]MCM3241777.1 EcsC family protein [Cytobacillus oceanisediminis]MCM3531751.1 EcsC family protein [Cytobacillus oceanisediminis]MCS0824370.1 EcsC family protein [Cytobacillus firmus]